MPDSFVMRFPVAGMNQTSPASLLGNREVAEIVNGQIVNSAIRSRPGIVFHDLPLLAGLAFQGGAFYNPAQGLSQQTIGQDAAQLVVAASGRKFSIKISNEATSNSTVSMEEVLGVAATNPIYHTVWMAQAENYLIAQDGNGPTWIWDGVTPARNSTGYNTENKEQSKLANAASLIAYAHGRIIQIIDGRLVLIGDIIHKTDISDASNILNMTEQVYWATGSFFTPPSNLGKAQALAILPLRNTTHGHGDLLIHCENGIFSLDLTLYPRESWVDQQVGKHVSLDTSATGFYAITLYDSDQIYLSRAGIHSLRSSAQVNAIGNPQRPLSERVQHYIERDLPQLLRFASVGKSISANRLFVTTAHILKDSVHHGGRGILVMNFRPAPGVETASWEGLWTLPCDGYIINQLVHGLFDGRERSFAFVTSPDNVIRLVEFSDRLNFDVMPNGEERRIKWQVVTRADTMGDDVSKKSIRDAVLTIKHVFGEVHVAVFARNDQTEWVPYRETCFRGADECAYGSAPSREHVFELGTPPESLKSSRWIQFLIKIEGAASIESLRIKADIDKGGESSGLTDTDCVNLQPGDGNPFEFNPFEYCEL